MHCLNLDPFLLSQIIDIRVVLLFYLSNSGPAREKSRDQIRRFLVLIRSSCLAPLAKIVFLSAFERRIYYRIPSPSFYYRPNRLVFPLSSEGFYYLISLLLLPHRVYGLHSLLDFRIFYLVVIYLRDVYFLATFLLVTRFLIAMLFYPVFSIPQSFYLSI